MKKPDWFVLIMIIIVIVAIGIWASMSLTSEPEMHQEKGATKLESLTNRLRAIQRKINDEIESLRLTTEMEQFLGKKIGRTFFLAKTVFLIVFACVVGSFVYSGSDFLTALFNTIGIAGFIAVAIPFLFLSKILDPNSLIDLVKTKIRELIYSKYGHNPAMIATLTDSIKVGAMTESELKEEIRTLNIRGGGGIS